MSVASTLVLRTLALPVANSTLQERQFYFFLETSQAAKKTGKRRTASEKNTSAPSFATSSFSSSSFSIKTGVCGGAGAGASAGTSSSHTLHVSTPQPTRLQNH
jgi:hypothetical protein